jgi:hypothetical protein
MSAYRSRRSHAPDSAEQHRNWLSLIDVSGPFLSLPVLRSTWPTLDSLDKPTRERLRLEHTTWQADLVAGQQAWIGYVLGELLGWGAALHTSGLDTLVMDVPEHDTQLMPSFALVEPGEDVKPRTTRLLGIVCEPDTQPTARVKGQAWAATPVDRLAKLCRHHDIELGLATEGRWWALVWAPRGGVTTTAVFDTVAWPEAAERDVVRAFVSLLGRRRFFGVPDGDQLAPLLEKSKDSQEEITEALGVQVRQAVELLVAAIGRADTRQRENDEPSLQHVDAHEVYRGAVSVMMRVVFLLFAEERGLLPSDNELYAKAYSAGRLCAELENRAQQGNEDDLEHTFTSWHRLIALFDAVYRGVTHPRLTMHAHDGSLFNPNMFPWLPLHIDDRTVLHMLRAVQHVEIGTGKSRERRTLSFRSLDVEQIGYVYEGLLSYDGFRADDLVVGLIGKQGLEEEVRLRDLESFAARCSDVPALAAAIAQKYKDSKIGSAAALAKKLAPLVGADKEEARKKLLAVVRGDYPLSERLLTFYGLIRTDLRDLPVVVMPGELYVTESPLRRNTGTHYTPKFLAEQIVKGALEPLVYSPGPLQTADKDEWKLKPSKDILALKVADIAVGSAAFLVAAARYLGDKLIEAWTREGDERVRGYISSEDGRGADEDPVLIESRRQIIEHCLYGVDINPMAVEMAKLSLWLVSMDPERPFTFLDDRLVVGDSLLGITSLDQLEYMHMDPKKGREIHERLLVDCTAGVRELVTDMAAERRKLADIDGSTLEGLARKRSVLSDVDRRTSRARLFADLTVGAALVHAGRGARSLGEGSLVAADYARRIDTTEPEARQQARQWLDTDRPDGGFQREPLHWPLVFPEVFEIGGFNAVIGNPPFLGGKKISGALGSSYREYLVDAIGQGTKGNADLIAFFLLRTHSLLNSTGQSGLIATNTLAQGDTREVGLDQLVTRGVAIRRSIKSEPWPSKSAVLEYCAVWISCAALGDGAERKADGLVVPGITPSLDPLARVTGNPHRLTVNAGISFQGSVLLGLGFTMDPEQAQRLIAKDRRNADVVFPYLSGDDVNSRPDYSASRWAINFRDWPIARAMEYEDCFTIVEREVKPQRLRANQRDYRELWWRYARFGLARAEAVKGLKRVLAITLHTKTVMPVRVASAQVFSHGLAVFATDDSAMLALLSSAPHYWWAVSRGSTLGAATRYTPSDVFETFPLPDLTVEIRELGDQLDTFRRDVMLSRDSGLTKTYNLIFDSACKDEDIEELRRIHKAIDEATIRAYGWEKRIENVGGLDYGFHPIGRETRYTIGPAAQREILDSLLELNHERYAEEVAQGLHDKKGSRKSAGDHETLL